MRESILDLWPKPDLAALRPTKLDTAGCPRPGKIRENREFCEKNSLQGKIREFGKMGKIREFYKNMSGKYQGIFSSIYIMIVSPFSRISLGST